MWEALYPIELPRPAGIASRPSKGCIRPSSAQPFERLPCVQGKDVGESPGRERWRPVRLWKHSVGSNCVASPSRGMLSAFCAPRRRVDWTPFKGKGKPENLHSLFNNPEGKTPHTSSRGEFPSGLLRPLGERMVSPQAAATRKIVNQLYQASFGAGCAGIFDGFPCILCRRGVFPRCRGSFSRRTD